MVVATLIATVNSLIQRQTVDTRPPGPQPPGEDYSITVIVVCTITLAIITWIPLIYLYLWLNYPANVNRIPIRQMVVISISNIIRSFLGYLIATVWNDGDSCRVMFWILSMSRSFSTWISFTVVLNLQLVICHKVRDTRKLEPYYYAVPFLIGLIPLILTLTIDPRPDVVISDFCYTLTVINPLPYGIVWPRVFVLALGGIVASLVSITYLLVYVFRIRMAIIREEKATFERVEGVQRSKQKLIIDQVNEEVAIKAPKTALIPGRARSLLIDRRFTLDDTRLNNFTQQTRKQSRPNQRYSINNLVPGIGRAFSMNVQKNPPLIPQGLQNRRIRQDDGTQQLRDYQINQVQQEELAYLNRIKQFLSSIKQKISSWIVFPIETIKEARERYRIISPLLLRLLWVPLAPMMSFIVEVAAFSVAARDKAKVHEWIHDMSDGIFFGQAIIQAYPFYTDTVIIGTLKAARKALIFKYLYKPNRELIIESFGNDDDRKAQIRKATYTNAFSRESQEIPSARVRITRTKHSMKSMASSNRGGVGAGAGTTQAESGTDTKKLPGEVERAFLDLWKFTAGIGGGDGRRQASLIPRFKNIKYRLKFYFVRYVLLTRGERRVYKMVFGPNRGNYGDQNI